MNYKVSVVVPVYNVEEYLHSCIEPLFGQSYKNIEIIIVIMMKIIENGSITNVKGIKATGITAGLKKSGKKDMALIYSEVEAVSAGVFTKNLAKAAPIILDIEHIKNKNTQGTITLRREAAAYAPLPPPHLLFLKMWRLYLTFMSPLIFFAKNKEVKK